MWLYYCNCPKSYCSSSTVIVLKLMMLKYCNCPKIDVIKVLQVS